MTRYVIATQREWGVKVFEQLAPTMSGLMLYADLKCQWTGQSLAAMLAVDVPRYVFFLNWSSRVPSDVLEMFPIVEAVNMHCTPLPYGRGGAPIENLLLRGHTETVVTAHRMTNEIDGGPIYGQRGPVSLAGTKEQILGRFINPVCDLVKWIVTEEPEPTPQVGDVTLFRRLPKADMIALWKAKTW